jgi:hypothetical protein
MNRPATPTPSATTAAKRTGTDSAALTELRNAAATYDHLRGRGDPVEFWEALRLARNRRSLTASAEPTPEAEADMVKELASIRRLMSPMVAALRRFLKPVSGLPGPLERFELALAFLLVSPREHQSISKWTDPALHGGKAVEKLKSLAAITDPYREALLPWTLQGAPVEKPPMPACDLGLLRHALSCCEILDGLQLNVALWEAIFLLLLEPADAVPSIDRLVADLEAGRLEEVQPGAEKLHAGTTALRQRYGKGVESLGTFMGAVKLLPADECAFDVALGLLLGSSDGGEPLRAWLESPTGGRELHAAQLKPLFAPAESLLQQLDEVGK